MMLGRYVDAGIDAIAPSSLNGDLVSSGVALLAIIGGTVILFSERELASRWGAKFLYAETAATPIEKKACARRSLRCHLERKRPIGARAKSFAAARTAQNDFDIENELIVANGTVKAIYAIFTKARHSLARRAVFEMLGTQAMPEEQTAANDEDCF